MPHANKLGLQILIGGAVREASVLGYLVTPLFSYYSCHGPVFRVLLQVHRGKLTERRDYGFICYCNCCGNTQAVSWGELGHFSCPCNNTIKDAASLVVSGPLWTVPLHSGGKSCKNQHSSHKYYHEHPSQVISFGRTIPNDSRNMRVCVIVSVLFLLPEGYAASRSHIASNATKTDCPMARMH